VAREKGGENRREATSSEKKETSTMNNRAGCVNVDDRVLVFKTEKTLSHQVDRNVELVTHATGGSEGVVDKAEMVKKKKVRNDARD